MENLRFFPSLPRHVKIILRSWDNWILGFGRLLLEKSGKNGNFWKFFPWGVGGSPFPKRKYQNLNKRWTFLWRPTNFFGSQMQKKQKFVFQTRRCQRKGRSPPFSPFLLKISHSQHLKSVISFFFQNHKLNQFCLTSLKRSFRLCWKLLNSVVVFLAEPHIPANIGSSWNGWSLW